MTAGYLIRVAVDKLKPLCPTIVGIGIGDEELKGLIEHFYELLN